jgi:hypothetical protein
LLPPGKAATVSKSNIWKQTMSNTNAKDTPVNEKMEKEACLEKGIVFRGWVSRAKIVSERTLCSRSRSTKNSLFFLLILSSNYQCSTSFSFAQYSLNQWKEGKNPIKEINM